MRARMMGLLTAGLLVAAGCDGDRPNADADAVGTMALSATGDAEVAGFQIDVATPAGAPVASRFVANRAVGSATVADAFFTLPPGDYLATATAASGPGAFIADCTPASAPATVRKGRTTELTLVVRCQGKGPGGLDVTGRTNFEPRLTSLSFAPSKYVATCEPVTLSVTAEDREGDAIRFAFHVVSAPATSGYRLDVSGSQATLTSSVAGDFEVQAQACDALGCAELMVPVHVLPAAGGGSCEVTCDDRNPCTADTFNADGTCGHARIPDGSLCTGGLLRVKLLGFNDFHGQVETGRLVGVRPVGGAGVLASYLRAAQAGVESQTILVHAGDAVGASPPASALLQDEPTIQFLNLLANPDCSRADLLNPHCNIVGTLGNHEFDEGRTELFRLLAGGNFATGPFLEDPYQGARFPYVSANVVDELTNLPILPPYVVKQVHGVPVAFIGAVLKETPTIVTPTGVAGLRFLDEAAAINSYVPELRAMGVRAMVVTIHQGGVQTSYTGPTRANPPTVGGTEILDIVGRLDSEIDVVISGHRHAFTNAFLTNAAGKRILVTQSFASGTAYSDTDLLVDPVSGDVTSSTAQVVTTFGDAGPGLTPDAAAVAIANAAQTRVAPLVSRVVGFATAALSRNQNAAGESTLGNLIADAQRAAMETQFAFMNPGGIRQDLDAGGITWGELFIIQPFGNTLVRMNLTGAQIYQVLEQQWLGQTSPRIMQISGFTYTWDPARAVGSRVLEVRLGGVAIDRTATYSITCNNFMATGGDNFTTFISGANQVGGPIDLDALVEYVEDHTPVTPVIDGRISLGM